jgi:hypothetical protein
VARSYHVAVVALAAECDSKWLDNLLSRHRMRGVDNRRQGTARKVSLNGVVHIAVTRHLVDALAMPAARALEVATQLCSSAAGEAALGNGLTLQLDLPRLQRELERRLREAAEVVVAPRRGRPPRNAKRPHR